MEHIENLLKSNFIIIVLILINLISIIITIYNTRKVNHIQKKYINFMKKIGNGSNIDEILKEYVEKVDYVAEENKILNANNKNIEKDMRNCIQKIGIIRYNAFDDVGSNLSFALAILDNNNTGIVLNGIYAQNSSNIYAKPVENGESKYILSNEEKEAIQKAINNSKN